jgi:quercetin dioxygenase-like cupin family protein
MAWSLAPFDSMAWAPGNHPLEQKKVGPAGLTLLSFEPGFSDSNWCERSHAIYVVQGTLHVELSDETVALQAGEALWIDAGTKHRASVRGGPAALVFIISDVAQSDAASD